MIISSYNIGKGLWAKIGVIKRYLEDNKIDVLFLIEAEIEIGGPQIAGYRFVTEQDNKKSRG